MYDRVLDVPRLVHFCDLTAEPAPHPAVARLRRRLNDVYAGELGEPFTTAGFCLYRDGSDSVAWHGDTIRLPGSSSARSPGRIVDSAAGRSSTETPWSPSSARGDPDVHDAAPGGVLHGCRRLMGTFW